MPIHKIIRLIQIVVSTVENDRVGFEILVILQSELERVGPIIIKPQVQYINGSRARRLWILDQHRLQLRRKILAGLQTKSPRRAAAKDRHALLVRLLAPE